MLTFIICYFYSLCQKHLVIFFCFSSLPQAAFQALSTPPLLGWMCPFCLTLLLAGVMDLTLKTNFINLSFSLCKKCYWFLNGEAVRIAAPLPAQQDQLLLGRTVPAYWRNGFPMSASPLSHHPLLMSLWSDRKRNISLS